MRKPYGPLVELIERMRIIAIIVSGSYNTEMELGRVVCYKLPANYESMILIGDIYYEAV
jgi:hypothetical protein